MIISTCLSSAHAADAALWQSLNAQEKQYLKQHPVIRVQNERDYPPFNYSINGKESGYSIDLISLIGKNLGIEVKFAQGKRWNEYVQMLKDRQLDVMANMMNTKARQSFANFTAPYAELSFSVVTRTGNSHNVRSKETLAKQRIAIVEGYAISHLINKIFVDTEFIVVKNAQMALKALTSNRADVFITNGAVANYYIVKHFIGGLELHPVPGELNFIGLPLSFATHKDNPILTDILQKAMNAIPGHELIQLREKWFVSGQPNLPVVALTPQERDYLSRKGSIRVTSGIEEPPFTFILNGVEQGFTNDLIRYISAMLNIRLDFIYGDLAQHLQRAKSGEIDLLMDYTNTPERRKIFHFTQPYVEYRNVLAIQKQKTNVEMSMEQLSQLTVAVLKDWATTIHLEQHYPNMKLYYANSPLDALMAVSTGKADAHVVSEVLSNYLIQKHLIGNLQNIPLVESNSIMTETLSFAISPKHQPLRNILDKALLAVPEGKLIELRRKWFGKFGGDTITRVNLNKSQKQWLLAHRQLKFFVPPIGLPLAQKSSKGYEGILAEFIQYIEGALSTQWLPQSGTDQQYIPSKPDEADMTIGSIQDPTLLENFNFSQPIIEMPIVIMTGNPARVYVDDLSELAGIKTGIVNGLGYQDQIQIQHPELQLHRFDSMTSAVLAVNSGDIDILLCPLAHCSYLMNELGANNVRIVGQTPFFDSLGFAVRKDWPQLLDIINATLASISPQRKNSIYKHWNSREDILVKVDYSRFWYLLIVAVIIIGFGIAWNRKISKYAKTVEIAHEELKNAQAQLVHSEKMASLGSLTAGVAHEINNPTNFAYVGVHNLEVDLKQCREYIFDLAGEDTEATVLLGLNKQFDPLFAHIHTVKDGIDRIKVIVQDLAAFTRLDASAKVLVNITDCIQSTVNLVRSKHLTITEFITDFEPTPKFACHQAQINQVLMNLIVNACDAIQQKQRDHDSTLLGKITINCRMFEGQIEVTITDDGCGMSEQTKKKLFEPFYTTKGVGEGTGLGMAISFGIIEEHNGSIEVESTEDVGSVICVRLPVGDEGKVGVDSGGV
ncbi:MAG: transporter substrate-binding domain-containing protein [Algicola sp.]|nr:transporter substrate-binding domain-containing protein [Algicola sp.]